MDGQQDMQKTQAEKQILSGARILLESLKKEGVKEIFGYPGGKVLSIYDELYKDDELVHYLVRHEQAAVHAAEGYARVTGKPGVAVVTSGPGACNTITGIANAYYDGFPIVVITGQVDSKAIGNDAFQEADIVGITRPCCKHNYLVKDTKDIARIMKEAFHIATTGKPGPVIVDLPGDILNSKEEFHYPDKIHLPGYNPNYKGHPRQVRKALELLYNAKKPVILAGGGVVSGGAFRQLVEIAHQLHIPVTNTLTGIGSFSTDDALSLGMIGMHGNFWANKAVYNCDVMLALGTRFSDRITGRLDRFCTDTKIIHVDVDPCSIGKNVPVDIPIVGDLENVLNDMLKELDVEKAKNNYQKKQEWLNKIQEWKSKLPQINEDSGKLSPQIALEEIYRATKDLEPIVATEVGQHQMWTAQLYKINKPRQFVTSGGLGTMGFGFPAAMGAQAALKDKVVINIAGDGSIQMNIQELATCVQYNFPVINCIMNNGYLGMVRQWQERLFEKRYSHTEISSPDFVKVAEAYGALGIRVATKEEIEPALRKAIEAKKPAFIEFIIEPEEAVYPWVLAGDSLDNTLMSKKCGMEDK